MRILLSSLILVCQISHSHGQNTEPVLSAALINDRIGFPSLPDLSSLNPGLQVSLQYPYSKHRVSAWFHKTSLTAISHRGLGNWAMLSSGPGYVKRLSSFSLELSLSPGYLIRRAALTNYRFESGRYIRAGHFDHRLMLDGAVMAGYSVRKVKLFISYEMFFEMPFMKESILLPHQLFGIGMATSLHLKGKP